MLPATKAEYKRARLCLVITQVILCATIVSMTVCLYFKPCPPPKKFFFKPKESGNGYDLYSTGTVSTLVVQTNEEFAFSDEHQETNETGNHSTTPTTTTTKTTTEDPLEQLMLNDDDVLPIQPRQNVLSELLVVTFAVMFIVVVVMSVTLEMVFVPKDPKNKEQDAEAPAVAPEEEKIDFNPIPDANMMTMSTFAMSELPAILEIPQIPGPVMNPGYSDAPIIIEGGPSTL